MAQVSLCDELLSQQQETINSSIRPLKEEISQNSQQAQRLTAEQGSSNLPKSILGQAGALIEEQHQNASKLQILEEINREAIEIAEEKHCKLMEARLNLTIPLTSEPEIYGGAMPKTTARAKLTSVAPGVLAQEAVAQAYSSQSKVRQEQQCEDYAALLRDEIFSVVPGTVNMQYGTASKKSKSEKWQ